MVMQIALASIDAKVCAYVAIAAHVEGTFKERASSSSSVVLGNRIAGNKFWIESMLKLFMSNAYLICNLDVAVVLGTHSLCKDTVTYCGQKNILQERTNVCGQWLRSRSMIAYYKDIHLPFPKPKLTRI